MPDTQLHRTAEFAQRRSCSPRTDPLDDDILAAMERGEPKNLRCKCCAERLVIVAVRLEKEPLQRHSLAG